MTNEKMLKKCYELKQSYSDVIMDAIIKELKEDIRAEEQKKKGNAKKDVLLKKLLKNANPQSPNLQNYCPMDGQFGFTDGYRGYILNDSYGHESQENFGKPIDFRNFISEDDTAAEKVTVDIPALRAKIKDDKAKGTKLPKPTSYNRTYGSPYEILLPSGKKMLVNPIYLLELLEMIGTDEIYVNLAKDCCYAQNKDKERGIVLIIRNPKEA